MSYPSNIEASLSNLPAPRPQQYHRAFAIDICCELAHRPNWNVLLQVQHSGLIKSVGMDSKDYLVNTGLQWIPLLRGATCE